MDFNYFIKSYINIYYLANVVFIGKIVIAEISKMESPITNKFFQNCTLFSFCHYNQITDITEI